jgi:hypothetical protein
MGYRMVERLYNQQAQQPCDERPRRLPKRVGSDEFRD